jgi:hypothetical protein
LNCLEKAEVLKEKPVAEDQTEQSREYRVVPKLRRQQITTNSTLAFNINFTRISFLNPRILQPLIITILYWQIAEE